MERLFLVGDPAVTAGWRTALTGEDRWMIVGERTDWWAAASMLREVRPDLCVIDLTRAAPHAGLALRRFHQIDPLLRLVAAVAPGDRRGRDAVDGHPVPVEVLGPGAGAVATAVRRALEAPLLRRRFVTRSRAAVEPAWATRPRWAGTRAPTADRP